ncbi:MAG: HEAT repeat domain-containing protein [Candidatus Ozemobacteraceae bacterium]
MEDIKKFLASADEFERQPGVTLAVRQPTIELFAKIRELALDDESLDVRQFARKAIQRMHAVLQAADPARMSSTIDFENLSKVLEGSETEKLDLIQEIFERHLTQAAPILIQHLEKETEPTVLAALVKCLGKLAGESAIKALLPFLGHPDYRVRADVIEGLALTGSLKGLPYIIQKLRDPDNRVMANAAVAIKKVSAADPFRVLKAIALSPIKAMQASAAYALQFFSHEEAVILAGGGCFSYSMGSMK